ncbi:MAG: hypothetical protein ABFD25_14535 [Clostridiaceae bacterium]
MKKKVLGKVLASAIVVLLCLSGISASAAEQNAPIDSNKAKATISPCFLAIVSCENNLTLNSGGRLTCEGKTEVQYGYIAGLTVELQQYDGQWNTIKTWNVSDNIAVSLSKDWYVASGYQYRLKLTHMAMNSNNAVIESFTSYSKTVVIV